MIAKKILYWYDKNKRPLPWRARSSAKKKEYFTLVSEFMLQQTQVKTVIPYFNNFLKNIPNFQSLAKVSEAKLLKHWQGLGYYSRAKNLKKSAKLIMDNYYGRLPDNFEELKKLPGVGDYTASAISAIAFNKQIIPLDGNIERVLKRILNLKTEEEIKKENLHKQKKIFGKTKRSSDYAQALMEIGALLCKPKNPYCDMCPIAKNCLSFKRNDFEIKKKDKKIIDKFYLATLYKNDDQLLLIKNDKFKFLKNLLIFPMKEITRSDSLLKSRIKLNVKMSNMNMSISIDFSYIKNKPKNGMWIEKTKLENYMIPTFTKKIFASVKNNL
ncbi:A/G-specific adenine glycosylase [Candidatus Pelagibacter sp. Uisw_134_02]|jgi:A/G-specific adenine glycosylase|uniref:A/G-specific adenine glycosylase n=1 Tax=Candidatus Pelagibacter sp. Uisw_134_02 TaxID=3230990 RepID=UPI0039EBE3FA